VDNLYYPSLAPDSGFLLAPPTDVSGPDRFTSFHCRPWHAKTVGAHHGWTAFIPEKAGSQITATRTLQVFEADLTEIAPIVVVYMQAPTLLSIGRMTVTLQLPTTGGLYRFSNVTYRGVEVGKVTDVHATRDGAEATLSLSTSPKIPADLQADVRSVSAIGEQYVDLQPRTSSGPYQ
jgi:hypothetical protein